MLFVGAPDTAANHLFFIEIKRVKFVPVGGPHWCKMFEFGPSNCKDKWKRIILQKYYDIINTINKIIIVKLKFKLNRAASVRIT